MKKKIIAGSILSIVMCSSLIAGATMALFTSESKTNVAITSGNVDIKASIVDKSINTYSAYYGTPDTSDKKTTYTAIEGSEGYYYQSYTQNGTNTGVFYSGSATVDENGDITLNNMLPGDKVSFDIEVVSTSNVTILYRSLFQITGDNGLYTGLRFTFEEKTADATVYDYSGNGTQVSKWTTIPANEAAFTKTYTVTIELPLGTENEYKNKTCSLSYVVEAIQGNAAIPQEASVTVGDTTTDYESLAEAIVEAAKYENSIVKPLTTVSYSVVIPANNGLTLDLNGADVSVVGASKSFTVKNSSATQSTLTLQNVTINGNEELNNKSALTVESGDVKLNALGVNKFYGVKGGNGIEIAKTATVNITGDTIQAYGNGGYEYAYVTNTYKGVTTTGEYTNIPNNSGISSSSYTDYSGSGIRIDSNNVIIDGVKSITAEGYGDGAYGIGGDATALTINDTTIEYARGGFAYNKPFVDKEFASPEPVGGAAIGIVSGTLTLKNVIVNKAEGGGKSAGIGGYCSQGDIKVNITNCTLKDIIGGYTAAAIGGGRANHLYKNDIKVNIVSSKINATGGYFGAAIGSGYDSNCTGYQYTYITIDDGITENYSTITAVGGERAAGIGSGYHLGHIYCVIAGGTTVNATAGAPYLNSDGSVKYIEAEPIGFGVVDKSREYTGFYIENSSERNTSYPGTYFVKVGDTVQKSPFISDDAVVDSSDLQSKITDEGGTIFLNSDLTKSADKSDTKPTLTFTQSTNLDLGGKTISIDSVSGKNFITTYNSSNDNYTTVATISNGTITGTHSAGSDYPLVSGKHAYLTLQNITLTCDEYNNTTDFPSGKLEGTAVAAGSDGGVIVIKDSKITGPNAQYRNTLYCGSKTTMIVDGDETKIVGSVYLGTNANLMIFGGDFTEATFYSGGSSSTFLAFGGTFNTESTGVSKVQAATGYKKQDSSDGKTFTIVPISTNSSTYTVSHTDSNKYFEVAVTTKINGGDYDSLKTVTSNDYAKINYIIYGGTYSTSIGKTTITNYLAKDSKGNELYQLDTSNSKYIVKSKS